MNKTQRVYSIRGDRFIDVVRSINGSYSLRKFVRKYDPEEEKSYEVRELPDPPGKYGDLDVAVLEAKRLLE